MLARPAGAGPPELVSQLRHLARFLGRSQSRTVARAALSTSREDELRAFLQLLETRLAPYSMLSFS